MLTMINNIIFVCLFDCNWLRTVMIIYNLSIANARAVELEFRKSIITSLCDDSSAKYEVVLTKKCIKYHLKRILLAIMLQTLVFCTLITQLI